MARIVALDTETYLIQPGNNVPPMVVSSWKEEGQKSYLLLPQDAVKQFRQYLKDGCILVGHNLAYDLGVFVRTDPTLLPEIFEAYAKEQFRDTRIRQELMDLETGRKQDGGAVYVHGAAGAWFAADYSLAGLEVRLLANDRKHEKEGENVWRLRYSELDGIPLDTWPEEAKQYALRDAEGTLNVFLAQGREDKPDETRQAAAAWAAHLMSAWGTVTDKAEVEALTIQVEKQVSELEQTMLDAGLYKIGGTKKDPKVTKNMAAIREAVEQDYASRGVLPPRTEKGAVKTDADTLDNADDTRLKHLGSGSQWGKIKSTYLPILRNGTHTPINTRFHILMNSGRMSSSNPNLQNLPREGGVRECFIPRKGFLFSDVDYDTAELRALGQIQLRLFGRSALAELFQKDPNADPHLALAATILGIPEEEAYRRRKDKDVKAARQYAKVPNFALPGGMGIRRFRETARVQYGIELSEQEANQLKYQWLARWPEMKLWFDFMSRRLGARQFTAIQQFHPKDQPHRIRGMCGYSDGLNTLFQGLIADGVKSAMFNLSRECYTQKDSPLYGARPVFVVHDETIVEVPEERASAAAKRHAEIMRDSLQAWIPDVPVTCSPALTRRLYKGPETCYNENGDVIVWEPK